MKKRGILVVGSANMDLVVITRRFPAPGETVFGNEFGMYPGGKGANQAVCAAKLGGRVSFIGKIGDDIFGGKLSRGMRSDGVRLNHLLVDGNRPTGTALISVDGKGQNEIVVVPGSNMKLLPGDIRRARAAFGGVSVLLLQLEIPPATVAEAAALARSRGVTVILNPAPARRLPRMLLACVDYLTPNETELHQLSGMPASGIPATELAARVLLEQGVKGVVVTLGARGCLYVDRTFTRLFPAPRVKALDTTGAGDAFNGALAFAIAEGKPVTEAIPFANAVAALSVTRLGAQCSMPTMRELRSFLD
jgi:ribokinase